MFLKHAAEFNLRIQIKERENTEISNNDKNALKLL